MRAFLSRTRVQLPWSFTPCVVWDVLRSSPAFCVRWTHRFMILRTAKFLCVYLIYLALCCPVSLMKSSIPNADSRLLVFPVRTGYIPYKEMRNVCRRFNVPVKREMLEELLQKANRNGQDEVDYAQFLNLLNWRDCPGMFKPKFTNFGIATVYGLTLIPSHINKHGFQHLTWIRIVVRSWTPIYRSLT